MKKRILAVLLAVGLVFLFAPTALAINYEYITLDESEDYTFVLDASGGSVTTSSIHVLGMDSSYNTYEISTADEANLTWTIPSTAAAEFAGTGLKTLTGTDTAAITVTAPDQEFTVTVTYTNDGIPDAVVTIFVAAEGTGSDYVTGIDVDVTGDTAGTVDQDNLTVPLFDLKDVFFTFGDDDVADVLKNSPSALHALLYALELQKDPDTGNPWDWDWVSNNVEIISQGSYVSGIASDYYGWTYTVNGDDPEHAASAHALNDNDDVVWIFTSW
jgi:hypothetical protein